MNENYLQPTLVKGAEEGIVRGMYLFESVTARSREKLQAQLLGSGAILNEVRAAARFLAEDFGVSCEVWSVTSFNELARDGQQVARWNMLNPDQTPKEPYVTQCLKKRGGPVVASTDYIKLYGEQIRAFVPATYRVLGTDGFGRSDTRQKLREFFEVDRRAVVIAVLSALVQDRMLGHEVVLEAMRRFDIDRSRPNPAFN
jgi:pyruvate dehydrogenase E1 component